MKRQKEEYKSIDYRWNEGSSDTSCLSLTSFLSSLIAINLSHCKIELVDAFHDGWEELYIRGWWRPQSLSVSPKSSSSVVLSCGLWEESRGREERKSGMSIPWSPSWCACWDCTHWSFRCLFSSCSCFTSKSFCCCLFVPSVFPGVSVGPGEKDKEETMAYYNCCTTELTTLQGC